MCFFFGGGFVLVLLHNIDQILTQSGFINAHIKNNTIAQEGESDILIFSSFR